MNPYTTDLEYLEDELTWIEMRQRRLEIEKKLRRGPTVFDHDKHEERKRLRRELKKLLDQENALRARIDTRIPGSDLALDRLCETSGLSPEERVVVLLVAAPCFSRRFRYEDDPFGAPNLTVEGAFDFLELSFAQRIHMRAMFRSDSPLLRDDILLLDMGSRLRSPSDLLQACLDITSRAFSFLVGDVLPADELQEFSSVESPRGSLDRVVIDARDKERILSVVQNHERYLQARTEWGFDDVIQYGRGVVMLFHGAPGTGKTLTAHAIADHLGKRVLNVDIPTFVHSKETERFLPALFREARLQNALLFFDECEALFASREQGNLLMNLLLTELERFEGVAVLATNLPDHLDEALRRRILVRVRFPVPDRAARRRIWEHHLPARAPLAADVDVERLAARYEIAGGYIKNAVLMAIADAVHTGADRITQAHLERAAEDQVLQDRADVPRARLADVALPETLGEQVRELVDAARERRRVLEQWGIGGFTDAGRGLCALLEGPPGTGKTLCAEAIAGELGRPFKRCALGAVLSPWVGGTEQNLTRLFTEARAAGAVLLLDEVDALLGDRAVAVNHDARWTSLLLTLIEAHDGLVLLASNHPDRLDPALARRVHARLAFPIPDGDARARIWRTHLPESAPGADTLDFERLADRYRMSGGHIRNAALRGAFRAARGPGRLSQAVVERAADEELRALGQEPGPAVAVFEPEGG